MSLEAIFKQEAGQLPYTPAAAKSGGEIIWLPDGRAAVVKSDLAASEKGAVYTGGLFKAACATGVTFDDGDPVFWDVSASTALAAEGAAGDHYLGMAVGDKTTELFVWVDLNAPCTQVRTGGLRGLWASRAVNIAHDDTAEFEILAAEQNPLGALVVLLTATITQVMAGSSQDQMIVTLYDSDDNAISTLTPSDAAADAVGDLVQGALSAGNAATGTVQAVIPAGKGAYLKVSQATVGTPAGEMLCQAIFCAAA